MITMKTIRKGNFVATEIVNEQGDKMMSGKTINVNQTNLLQEILNELEMESYK